MVAWLANAPIYEHCRVVYRLSSAGKMFTGNLWAVCEPTN